MKALLLAVLFCSVAFAQSPLLQNYGVKEFPNNNYQHYFINAINDSGDVVGYAIDGFYHSAPPNGGGYPFLWKFGENYPRFLDTNFNGGEALSINNNGDICGYEYRFCPECHITAMPNYRMYYRWGVTWHADGTKTDVTYRRTTDLTPNPQVGGSLIYRNGEYRHIGCTATSINNFGQVAISIVNNSIGVDSAGIYRDSTNEWQASWIADSGEESGHVFGNFRCREIASTPNANNIYEIIEDSGVILDINGDGFGDSISSGVFLTELLPATMNDPINGSADVTANALERTSVTNYSPVPFCIEMEGAIPQPFMRMAGVGYIYKINNMGLMGGSECVMTSYPQPAGGCQLVDGLGVPIGSGPRCLTQDCTATIWLMSPEHKRQFSEYVTVITLNNRGFLVVKKPDNQANPRQEHGSGQQVLLFPIPRGDMNNDGILNNFDIDPFVDCVLGIGHDCARGDMNEDGRFDNFDIDLFITTLIGN
jgi:hypothetical protein